MKILRAKYSRIVGSQLEALGVLGSKTWGKQTPTFIKKNGGLFSSILWYIAWLFPKNGCLFSSTFWSKARFGLKFWFEIKVCLLLKRQKNDPIFWKKMGACFLQLFDSSTPKASNCDPMARKYFTHNHSYKNSFKQCKISYNLIKFCRIWELKVSTESRDNFLCFCTLPM